jgi:hypothetical protein
VSYGDYALIDERQELRSDSTLAGFQVIGACHRERLAEVDAPPQFLGLLAGAVHTPRGIAADGAVRITAANVGLERERFRACPRDAEEESLDLCVPNLSRGRRRGLRDGVGKLGHQVHLRQTAGGGYEAPGAVAATPAAVAWKAAGGGSYRYLILAIVLATLSRDGGRGPRRLPACFGRPSRTAAEGCAQCRCCQRAFRACFGRIPTAAVLDRHSRFG